MAKGKKKRAGAKRAAPKPKRPDIRQPKKDLAAVQKEIRQVRSKVYAINRKIKEAPTKYRQRKLNQEKKKYLVENDERLQGLIDKRSGLKQTIHKYEENLAERNASKRRLTSIREKIKKAKRKKGNQEEVERLRYLELKELGLIDKLTEKVGVELQNKTDVSKFKRDDLEDEGGAGFELDEKSPYAIWEAIKQLHTDLDQGAFKYFIVNGKRFAADNRIQITAEASAFWIDIKGRTGGTPYVLRYVNFKSKTVKYSYYQSI
jgi:hypothetical protein